MDNSMYDAENIISSFENGSFPQIYGHIGRSTPREILTQLDTFISCLNTTLIRECYLEIANFNGEEKKEFFEKIQSLIDIFSNIAKLKDKSKNRPYVFKCYKCGENVFVNVCRSDLVWNKIQQHGHFEELLSNSLKCSELTNTILDSTNSNTRNVRSLTNCSCAITLPTNFKFDFNITYFKEVEHFYHITKKFHNDTVNLDGDNYYTLRILDDNMFTCFICVTTVGIKSIESHLKGKRHYINKISQITLPDIATFHKSWMNQELLYQIHQVYFLPHNKLFTSCELCSSNIKYELLQSHILGKKHKTNILKLLNAHPNLNYLQMQAKVYTEVVNPSTDQIDCTAPSSLITTNEVMPNDLSHITPSTCNNCSSLTSPHLKFNFEVTYNSTVESLIYDLGQISDKVMLKSGFTLHTIQRKNVNECICLLCCCIFNIKIAEEHTKGQKHLKKVSCDEEITILQAYHNYWIGQESDYQAHQVYFFPSSINSLNCHLCNNLNVFYDLVHYHIKDDNHKQLVFQDPSNKPLFEFQQKVYQNGNSGFGLYNDIIMTQSENKCNVNNGSCTNVINDIQPSTSANVSNNIEDESEKSESESEDEEMLDQDNIQTAPTGANHESVNKEAVGHQIVKSFDTDSPNELHRLIQHRFWSHFEEKMEICDSNVKCRLCKVTLSKTHDVIFFHVTSSSHIANTSSKKKYKFYCDICNTHITKESTWFHHLKHDRHKDRCQSLGVSRQQKLTEYECVTCRFVFFGDSMSVKRHNFSKAVKGKRSKKVTLHQKIKNIFNSDNNIIQLSNMLVKEAKEVLQNDARLKECCRLIKEALMELYPDCDVYPFGSQVSGLGSSKSDLDLFVDLGDMYFGNKNQDSRSQVKFVTDVMKIFGKKPSQFKHLNPIASARTPIVQVFHVPTQLDCDLSFRHGLSVENTKFLRFCLQIQPTMQPLILVLKQWLQYSKLAGHITTYSLSMMVIFFYQTLGYLTPVHKLKRLASGVLLVIDGWGVIDFDSVTSESVRNHVKVCDKSLRDLLVEFFQYYSSFNYERDVICPLLGHPIEKSLFLDNAQRIQLPLEMSIYVNKVANNTTEHFRAQSAMCIQDPFDLSHNLTKGCSLVVIQKLKKVCSLTHTFLLTGK